MRFAITNLYYSGSARVFTPISDKWDTKYEAIQEYFSLQTRITESQ